MAHVYHGCQVTSGSAGFILSAGCRQEFTLPWAAERLQGTSPGRLLSLGLTFIVRLGQQYIPDSLGFHLDPFNKQIHVFFSFTDIISRTVF